MSSFRKSNRRIRPPMTQQVLPVDDVTDGKTLNNNQAQSFIHSQIYFLPSFHPFYVAQFFWTRNNNSPYFFVVNNFKCSFRPSAFFSTTQTGKTNLALTTICSFSKKLQIFLTSNSFVMCFFDVPDKSGSGYTIQKLQMPSSYTFHLQKNDR